MSEGPSMGEYEEAYGIASAVEPEVQSRFAFPYPTESQSELRKAILWLMMDGQRRSILEIQNALGTRKEIGARIRELRRPEYGAWAFTDARSEGPDPDGVYRYQLRGPKPKEVSNETNS